MGFVDEDHGVARKGNIEDSGDIDLIIKVDGAVEGGVDAGAEDCAGFGYDFFGDFVDSGEVGSD